MDDGSNEDLFDRKELRKKKDKKRQHKTTREQENCTKESFKKMKEEIDDLRKKELERQKELDELKRKIEEREAEPAKNLIKIEYELGFEREAYLRKGFIESAKWIKTDLAKKMIEKMTDDVNKSRFESFIIAKQYSLYLGIRTCARYNRGEECTLGKWHATHRPDWIDKGSRNHQHLDHQQGSHQYGSLELETPSFRQKKNEMRLHACTLCLEALGSAHGHSVLNCPWILKKNWNAKP